MEQQIKIGENFTEQGKNTFTEPMLEKHEELLEITGQFAGTFSV